MNVVDELLFEPIAKLAARLRTRELSVLELVDATLKNTRIYGPGLNCYVTVDEEGARREATRLDSLLRDGHDLGPLHGLPLSIKDNIETAGLRTTAGSPFLRNNVPDNDATVGRRLRAAGAVIFAKANLHNFAYGAPHPEFGAVRNPWHPDASSGGSSSGSASAVAAGLCTASIGTDTGGSIRIPAACCGIVGLKPTYGRIGRRGVIPFSDSLDCVGPMARSVTDLAAVLDATAGADPDDPTAARERASAYVTDCIRPISGLRIGVPAEQLEESLAAEVRAAVHEVRRTLELQGAHLVDVDLPRFSLAVSVKTVIYSAEGAEYHRRYLPLRRTDYAEPMLSLLDAGGGMTAAEYIQAQRARQAIREQLDMVFGTVDALVLPTLSRPAPLAGVQLDASEISLHTSLFSVAGVPAITIPCGMSEDGRPLGAQIVGPAWGESIVLALAAAYERTTAWSEMHPTMDSWPASRAATANP